MPYHNERGLTLVEVLLSIIILSIILATFMNFFTQMGLMNKVNEDKQVAINTAKQQLINWQDEWKDYLGNFLEKIANNEEILTSDIPDGIENIEYKKNEANEDFYVFKTGDNIELWIKEKPDLQNGATKNNLLIVKVLNDKNKVISETYGYISYEEES